MSAIPARPPAPAEFRPAPARGRLFTSTRLIRRADAAPSGRVRFDALARYLQDVAEDDVTDTGWQAPYEWLLRRCAITVRDYPRRGERIRLETFCSGIGPRWAERTTTLHGDTGPLIQSVAIWVAIDPGAGIPVDLGAGFRHWYGAAAGDSRVSARLSLPGPAPGAPGRPWPLRAADLDAADHVGNTVHWAAAEDALTQVPWRPATAVLEYHAEILPGTEPELVTAVRGDRLQLWLTAGQRKLAAGLLTR